VKAALLVVSLLAGGCTTMQASHALMATGLLVATGGAVAPGEHTELEPAAVSVGLVVFAVGWVLRQSDDPIGGSAPTQRVYTQASPLDGTGEKLGIYRRLPADHAMFTR
jgi:hypothetical protein